MIQLKDKSLQILCSHTYIYIYIYIYILHDSCPPPHLHHPPTHPLLHPHTYLHTHSLIIKLSNSRRNGPSTPPRFKKGLRYR